MKWSLLGIIVVVCLQLGFSAYNAMDRPLESMIAVNEIASGANPIANVITDDNMEFSYVDRNQRVHNSTDETVAAVLNRRRSSELPEANLPADRKVIKTTPAKAAKNIFQFVAIQPSLDPITITYPKAPRPGGGRESYPASAYTAAASEKRSFASRSLSILKKSYSLLRSLGNKVM